MKAKQFVQTPDCKLSLLHELARFAASIEFIHMPEIVIRQAALNILDTVACMASGAQLEESVKILAAECSRGGPQEASVLGAGQRLPVEAATRVNAYMGDIFELNDLIGGHASIAVVPPALALAEFTGASGTDLIEAVTAGTEVLCRVHGGFYAKQKPFTEVAMVQVTVASAIGAAVTAGKLMKLDTQSLRHAMEIAGALTSWGPAELVFGEGNSIKPILFGGWPGAIGLMAANYARAGLTGASRLLESPIGYYSTVAHGYDRDIILDFERWHLQKPRRKLHACCGYMHSAIDAVVQLRHEGTLCNAHRIRVHVPAYIVPAVAKFGKAPLTSNEARFNLEYCMAHAIVDSDIVLPEHSVNLDAHLARAEIRAALARFDVVAEPAFSHYRYVRVDVLGTDGNIVRSLQIDAARGTEWNPMSDDEVCDKFRRLTGAFFDPIQAGEYIQRFDRLESEPDCDWILQSFNRKG